MARIRADFVLGATEAPLTGTDTTLSSAALARLPVVAAGDVAAITLQGDPASGTYEVVHVVAHSDGATTATVVRGQEGSLAQAWNTGTPWTHGPTAADLAGTIQGEWAAGAYPANALVTQGGQLWTAEVDTSLPPMVEDPVGNFVTNWAIRNASSASESEVTLAVSNGGAKNAAMASHQTWTPDWTKGLKVTVDVSLTGGNDEFYLGFMDASLAYPPPGEVDQQGLGHYLIAINIVSDYIFSSLNTIGGGSTPHVSDTRNGIPDSWSFFLANAGAPQDAYPYSKVHRHDLLLAQYVATSSPGSYWPMPESVRVVFGARTSTTAAGTFTVFNTPVVSYPSGDWRSVT